MVEYKSLRVPEDAWEEAKAQKEAEGRTWGEQIVRTDAEDVEADTTQPSAEEIAAEIDALDEATLAEYVADYLVSEYQLPRKVAEEVRGGVTN